MVNAFFSSDYLKQAHWERNRRLVFRLLIVFFLCIVVSYFAYQARAWILVPDLTVTSPADGATLFTSRVVVEGEAEEALELTINGLRAYSDETGRFSQELLLPPGIHSIEVIARDRFGKEQTITRQIVVKE